MNTQRTLPGYSRYSLNVNSGNVFVGHRATSSPFLDLPLYGTLSPLHGELAGAYKHKPKGLI